MLDDSIQSSSEHYCQLSLSASPNVMQAGLRPLTTPRPAAIIPESMRKLAYAVVLLGFVAASHVPCRASTIAIEIKATTAIANGVPGLQLQFANRGDESAFAVEAQAFLGHEEITASAIPILSTDRVHTVSIAFSEVPQVPGAYPVTIRVAYVDGRGTPFSIVNVVPLNTVPLEREEPVAVKLPSLSLLDKSELSVDFATAYTEDIEGTLTLIVPDDIECLNPVRQIVCPPLEDVRANFHIRRKQTQPGSAYVVLAVLQYVRNGRHHFTAGSSLVHIVSRPARPLFLPVILAVVFLLIVLVVLQRSSLEFPRRLHAAFDLAALAVLAGFTAYHIPLHLLLADTLTVGGDTVAHNYLAAHLGKHLFGAGRIVSWAPGWWCGFPAFQFYFSLPYVCMALLDLVLPFNVAFKLVTVAGIFLLPCSAYVAGRLGRFPRPTPILLAVATLPLLFDRSHTMWGVNIYSTLAGMIANSLSFPIMLLFMGSTLRDMDDRRLRYTSVLLLVALLASHFFTSIVAIASLSAVALLRRPSEWRGALLVLAREFGLAFMLMAWWIVPLLAKRSYSIDFGLNWDVGILSQMPGFAWCVMPLCLAALYLGVMKRVRAVAVFAVLLFASVILFHIGYSLSPVFVNVRLWPFIVYALLALAAVGMGLLTRKLRFTELVVAVAVLLTLTFGIGQPNHVHPAAEWNYSGLERKPAWPILRKLIAPLHGTPGRLANDLHSDNENFGSSRIFECVPYLVGKPVLEGGIVNSALGSLFAYYVQGETSRSCAGFPPIVEPPTFNAANATRHLKLFNVKHFIARWPVVRSAFGHSAEWKSVRRVEDWELFELVTSDGRYVIIPRFYPGAVRTKHWKQTALDWMDVIEWLDRPLALLSPGEEPPPHQSILSESAFKALHADARAGNPDSLQLTPVPLSGAEPGIIEEQVTDHTIRFRTRNVGAPHIIKISYYPNWKVRGAARVYMVTPGFMLVYPLQEEVELYYGSTVADNVGRAITGLGLGVVMLAIVCAVRRVLVNIE